MAHGATHDGSQLSATQPRSSSPPLRDGVGAQHGLPIPSWEGYADISLAGESTLEADVAHANVGDMLAMLPASYCTIDEWDRRRRAERSRVADAYMSLFPQHVDASVYLNYMQSASSMDMHPMEARAR